MITLSQSAAELRLTVGCLPVDAFWAPSSSALVRYDTPSNLCRMAVSEFLTRRFVGSYERGSVSATMRQRRWELFASTFPRIGQMRVLDVGGDARSWVLGGVKPKHLTVGNIGGVPEVSESWMTGIEFDACDAPDDLGEFDLVFSNSVIEHVGGHWRRQRYAEFIRSSAPSHWVQTPYRYFPIEPHYLAPLVQHLPIRTRAAVIARWPVGNFRGIATASEVFEGAQDIELLARTEMRTYFPDSELLYEKVGPLTKSLIAVRRA